MEIVTDGARSARSDALLAENRALRAALEPFARAGRRLLNEGSSGYRKGSYDNLTEEYRFRVGQVIHAAEILDPRA